MCDYFYDSNGDKHHCLRFRRHFEHKCWYCKFTWIIEAGVRVFDYNSARYRVRGGNRR